MEAVPPRQYMRLSPLASPLASPEGKPSDQIARETYHSLDAVDRYLGQYDRVRHCRLQGLSPEQTAHILDCSLRLVEEYLAIDRELEASRA